MNQEELQIDAQYIEKIKKAKKWRKIVAPFLLLTGVTILIALVWLNEKIQKLRDTELCPKEDLNMGLFIGIGIGFTVGLALYSAFNAFLTIFLYKKVHKDQEMLVKYYEAYKEKNHNEVSSTDG
jgi:uncharacterized membrane protein YukC